MNFHHVRAFYTIVAEGSFSRAADVLHITQPTISAQVAAMAQLQGLDRGQLELGASTVLVDYILPAALAECKVGHPAIDVTLCVGNSHDVRQMVRESRLEVGLVGEQVRDERLAFEPLVE